MRFVPGRRAYFTTSLKLAALAAIPLALFRSAVAQEVQVDTRPDHGVGSASCSRRHRTTVMIKLVGLALGILAVLSSASGARADEIALCNALASDDASRAPIVAFQSIDSDRGIVACAAALAAQPTSPALIHQYARTLERGGRLDDAKRLYGWAASDNYPPAVAALARLNSIVAAPALAWSDAERQSLSSEMAAAGSVLRRYADALPADPADPLAVLAATGTDPNAILAWVGEHTRLVAYMGSLRGAGGVLADRAGNSLDRSLLLVKLLTQAGQEVRLAHAPLPAAQAAALFGATRASEVLPRLPPLTRDQIIAQFSDARLPAEQVAAAATEVIDRRARTEKLLAERTDALLPTLLAASQPAQESGDAEARTAALTALADHYWVQMRAGAGWRDLDPDTSFVGALVPTDTLAPKDLPDSLRHSVLLRVILELQDATGRHEEQLLSHTVYPADDGVQTLTLTHTGKGLDALEQMLGAPDLRQRTLGALDGVTAWTPILVVGNATIVDRLFTRDGTIRPANVNAFATTGRNIGGLFSDVGDALSGDAPAAQPPAIPTAEWLEIEVRVPGAEPRIERRTIFDLLGPAARASGEPVAITADLLRLRSFRLVGPTDILIAGAAPSEISVSRASAGTVARIADNVRSFAAMPGDAKIADLPTGPRVPLTLMQFAGRRLRDSTSALISPNVFLMHDRFGWAPVAGASRQTEFDIVFNDVAGASFAERLRQGLIDTIIENAMVGDPQSGNASALHAVDLAAGRPWKRVTAGDAAPLAALSPDARSRVVADLSAGYIVIAPGESSAATFNEAWWRIDPRTGTTLGMMSSGGGAELAEAAILFYQGATSAACFVSVAMAVNSAIFGKLGGYQAGVGLLICAAATAGGAAAATAAGSGVLGGLGAGGAANIIAALLVQAAVQ
jgi:hypothetical protein